MNRGDDGTGRKGRDALFSTAQVRGKPALPVLQLRILIDISVHSGCICPRRESKQQLEQVLQEWMSWHRALFPPAVALPATMQLFDGVLEFAPALLPDTDSPVAFVDIPRPGKRALPQKERCTSHYEEVGDMHRLWWLAAGLRGRLLTLPQNNRNCNCGTSRVGTSPDMTVPWHCLWTPKGRRAGCWGALEARRVP